jgi:hypothetical protein
MRVVSLASRSLHWEGLILNTVAGYVMATLCCELGDLVSVFVKMKAVHAILVIFNLLVISVGVMFVATLLFQRYGRPTTKRRSHRSRS